MITAGKFHNNIIDLTLYNVKTLTHIPSTVTVLSVAFTDGLTAEQSLEMIKILPISLKILRTDGLYYRYGLFQALPTMLEEFLFESAYIRSTLDPHENKYLPRSLKRTNLHVTSIDDLPPYLNDLQCNKALNATEVQYVNTLSLRSLSILVNESVIFSIPPTLRRLTVAVSNNARVKLIVPADCQLEYLSIPSTNVENIVEALSRLTMLSSLRINGQSGVDSIELTSPPALRSLYIHEANFDMTSLPRTLEHFHSRYHALIDTKVYHNLRYQFL